MLLLAHRGASADAPENTLEAFREAVAQGADGVELDAMVCGSGEVVVCHDEDLLRLAGIDWKVSRTPYRKLRRLDVGTPLGFAKAQIPLLEAVLEVLPRTVQLNLELKGEEADDRGLCLKVVELVRRHGWEERVLVSSFNPLHLLRVAIAAPTLRRGYLIDPDKRFWLHGMVVAPVVSSHSVHPSAEAITPARVEAWRAAKLELAAWTVDDPEEARRLQRLGVRYCITNRPGALRRELAALDAGVPALH
jgi:glycerophosphoryl diester phosphodiesterase